MQVCRREWDTGVINKRGWTTGCGRLGGSLPRGRLAGLSLLQLTLLVLVLAATCSRVADLTGGLQAHHALPSCPCCCSPLAPPPPTAVVPVALSDWWYILRGGDFQWYLSRLDALLAEMHAK